MFQSRTRRPIRVFRPRGSDGFTLVEVAIASILASASVLLLLAYDSDRLHTQAAQAQGDLLRTLNDAVTAYEAANFSALVNHAPVAGFANPYAPQLSELVTGSYLTGNFANTNIYGGGYLISLAVLPAGCVAPNCNVGGTTSLNAPILNTKGQPDFVATGAAMAEAGGDAGMSSATSPNLITGPNATWSMANPLGSVAGIFAMRNGYLSNTFSAFLRRDGSLPMTGTLSLGGNNIAAANTIAGTTGNITNVNSTTVTGTNVNGTNVNGTTINGPTGNITTVNAQTVNTSWVVSQNGSITSLQTSDINNAGTITTNALNAQTLSAQTGQITTLYTANMANSGNIATNTLSATGRLATNEYVQVGGYASAGSGCSPNGLIGQDGAGGLLTCQNGTWGRFQTFQNISTTQSAVDSACSAGDPNPPGYNYAQWAIVCGSRFCRTNYNYGFGLVVESPGTSADKPFESSPGSGVSVACSR